MNHFILGIIFLLTGYAYSQEQKPLNNTNDSVKTIGKIKDSTKLKDLFLKLTEYTIPYGHETKLEKYLPTGYKKDSIGNYYIQVGLL